MGQSPQFGIYRITIAGKRRHIGPWPFPTVSFEMGPELARDAYMHASRKRRIRWKKRRRLGCRPELPLKNGA